MTNKTKCIILISVIITIIDYKIPKRNEELDLVCRYSEETGTKVSDHIKSKKRKGEYHYEEMGLYSMRLCL